MRRLNLIRTVLFVVVCSAFGSPAFAQHEQSGCPTFRPQNWRASTSMSSMENPMVGNSQGFPLLVEYCV
jgi:hypothetical protein